MLGLSSQGIVLKKGHCLAQEIRHLKAEIKSKEQTLADYAHQLDAERRQVEELETSLLMQVDHPPLPVCSIGRITNLRSSHIKLIMFTKHSPHFSCMHAHLIGKRWTSCRSL